MVALIAASFLLQGGRQVASKLSALHRPLLMRPSRLNYFSSAPLFSQSVVGDVTSGNFLKNTMLYFDSGAFLLSNQLGIPSFIASAGTGKTPTDVAKEFNLSVRGASALLVTLCRMDVVQVIQDSNESVDDIVYGLSPSAEIYLANRSAESTFSPFADMVTKGYITPEALLDSARLMDDKKDIMSEHLEEGDEAVANNARDFMTYMNAISYCCAKAFPNVLDLQSVNKPTTLLDVGGGSAIFTIEAVKSNLQHMKGIVYELPAIKPITEEYVEKAGLSDVISVSQGDFFKADPFPGPVDYVLFSNILHDWPDEVNMKLIEKAFDCLNSGGSIVISELLLSDDVKNSTSSSTSMNVLMVPYTKGRQYRPKELFRRLERMGFIEPNVKNLVDDYDLVIAKKP